MLILLFYHFNSSFKRIFDSVYEKETTVWHDLTTVWDWKEWLASCVYPITGHSKPHAFRFLRDSQGQATIFTKTYSSQETWSRDPFFVLAGIPTG